jgi:homogentisate 1,2-dioxygenase
MAVHLFFASRSMTQTSFFNADGELLIVPQQGRILVFTEMGKLDVGPCEICLVPRGMKFRVEVIDGPARGYVCENYGAKFTLPERGPIGANCLANPRDFKTPVAAFEDVDEKHTVIMKWCGGLYATDIDHSPLDVVAWHGNYTPFKYDLRTFSPVNAVLFDHPDPSIFTVLTAPSETPGTGNIAEHTFRPPWYHMNIMSEFMGLIHGVYDAKEEGFLPGGMSLHNCMLPHGPDLDAFEKASTAEMKPHKLENTLAFMFETRFAQHLTSYAARLETLQDDYASCWDGLEKKFSTKGAK